MNPDQTMAIRIAIRDTTGAIARQETPEPTRTALQTHLDALLKEELRALTGQALDGDLTGEYEAAEQTRAKSSALRQASADAMMPTPWYPDDSGDWVEVPDVYTCRPLPLAEDTEICYMYQGERERRSVNLVEDIAGALTWSEKPSSEYRIVAYKVVKP